MSEDEIKELMSLALLSPTSFNMQNWRFVVITDPAQREEIKAAAWGQEQVTDASIVIMVCADLKAYAKDPARYWKDAPQATQDLLVPMITNLYEGKDQLQRDEAMRSGGIAAQTIMLAAKNIGYDSCPMIGYDPEAVSKIINLPEDHTTVMMITVGKALKPAHARGGQLDYDEVVVRNKF